MKSETRPGRGRARRVDRTMLRSPAHRYLDGLWIRHLGNGGGADFTPDRAGAPAHQALRPHSLRSIAPRSRARLGSFAALDIANFEYGIYTCQIDTRYCLAETTTLELLAAVIVHEATHARLWRRGIRYEEAQRPRIEEICIRREIAFAVKLPNGETVRDQAERSLAFCATGEHWTSTAFRERYIEGGVEVCVTRARPVGSRWSSAGFW